MGATGGKDVDLIADAVGQALQPQPGCIGN